MPLRKIGIISGHGALPGVIALEAKKKGIYVIAIVLSPLENAFLERVADESYRVHAGDMGGLLGLLKDSGISDVVMAGKVPKEILYRGRSTISLDPAARRLLGSVNNLSDDTLVKAIIKEFERSGIRVLKTTLFADGLLAEGGVLTHRHPKRYEWHDIFFGWGIAKRVGRLQIGQTVVVKDRAVMAVEAMEGTDQAIRRGGRLAGQGAVVVKLSRPQQDMRYDVPVVGVKTLGVMKAVEASVLALEARRCIILDKERFIKKADKYGISVIGISRGLIQQAQA